MFIPVLWLVIAGIVFFVVLVWGLSNWSSALFWQDHSEQLRDIILRDRLMFMAGATPREPIPTPYPHAPKGLPTPPEMLG